MKKDSVKILKKNGELQKFDGEKIKKAIRKSAERVCIPLTSKDEEKIVDKVRRQLQYNETPVPVSTIHNMVECALDSINPSVAKSYREYRDNKSAFASMLDKVYNKKLSLNFIGDRSNANADSALITTQKAITYNELNSELYKKFFLTVNEERAMSDGYIYIHDRGSRLDSINCCIFDMANVLKDGFQMGNLDYSEPNSLDVAFDLIADISMNAAACQYGGFSINEIDKLLAPYAEKSYIKYYSEYMHEAEELSVTKTTDVMKAADKYANEKVEKDFEQGFQGWEMKFNSVASSRGDYPFTSISFGLGFSKFETMASSACMRVRKNGQGKNGFKHPVLFPKLSFFYDEELHGKGKPLEWLFDEAIDCSRKAMYPDYISCTGDGYAPTIYKKYGTAISRMGCRANLSPWFKKGGMSPADKYDVPIYNGRFNMGAISLHFPMIAAKAKHENRDFYEVLTYYLDMCRDIHKRTFNYLSHKKAGTNPLGFCQGGFYKGKFDPEDEIGEEFLRPMTMSFGITALNETSVLMTGKSIAEDNSFAIEVLKFMNDYADKYKKEDGILYALYGTPAESLCFSGDTLVQTSKGDKPIKDITTDDLVYSYNEKNKRIELKPVIASKCTSNNAQVVRVNFTNGQSVICTPNHRFATRHMTKDSKGRFVSEDIKYVDAGNLKCGQRIKSNYISVNSDGHYKCTTDQYIHDINAEYFLGKKPKGYVVHHKNENKLDNSFENLEYMLDADHRKYHAYKNISKYQYTSQSTSGKLNPFYGKHHSEYALKLNKEKHLGKNNVNAKSVVQLSLEGEIINIFESRGIAELVTGFKNLSYACNGKYSSKENSHEYKGYLWYFKSDIKGYSSEKNHKVKSVEWLTETIPVYDIEVADNHNFYVGGGKGGILVHNCGLQVEQFRKKYGIVKGVSDRPYTTNSFHCGVWEDITPIEKQDIEYPMFHLCNGGNIQYCRYPIDYNTEAIKTLVRRAMDMGFYEGVNLQLDYCEKCGFQFIDSDTCPKCGSEDITRIERMNGYLGYSRINGKTMYADHKLAEFKDRKSM